MREKINDNNVRIENGKIHVSDGIDYDYNNFPHGLIVGNSGTGKTFLMLGIVGQLLTVTKFVTIFDPRKSYLSSLKQSKSMKDNVFNYVEDINNEIHLFYNEMLNRAEKINNIRAEGKFGSYVDYNFAPRFIIFDNFEIWVSLLTEQKLGSDGLKDFYKAMSELKKVSMMGRELGLFLIIGTQDITSNVLPLSLRNQLTLNILMGYPSKQVQERMFIGDETEMLSSFSGIKGSGFIKFEDHIFESFIAPEIPKDLNWYEWIDYMSSLRK